MKRGESMKRIIFNALASSHPSIDRPATRFAREGLPRKESREEEDEKAAERMSE
jgi:hypothetical protein